MSVIVLLRGVNVGGHRVFRPAQTVKQLVRFDVVNVGAAGTFVVRQPGSRRELKEALVRALPISTDIVFCDGSTLCRLESDNPFGGTPPGKDVVRFVSFLTSTSRRRPTIPLSLPSGKEWLVRVVASRDRMVFGEYRRHMKTIGYLGQLDRLFGGKATTRNWNTVSRLIQILNE
jgi:uncharacterized protein (DUF1697 family)